MLLSGLLLMLPGCLPPALRNKPGVFFGGGGGEEEGCTLLDLQTQGAPLPLQGRK